MDTFEISYNITNDYLKLLTLFICSTILACFLSLFSYILVYSKPDSEKLSVYECGYEPYDNTRHIFNIRFYLIAIFFIVFDVEILFIIPWAVSIAKLDLLGLWVMVDFILELGLGFFYIYYTNCLSWK